MPRPRQMKKNAEDVDADHYSRLKKRIKSSSFTIKDAAAILNLPHDVARRRLAHLETWGYLRRLSPGRYEIHKPRRELLVDTKPNAGVAVTFVVTSKPFASQLLAILKKEFEKIGVHSPPPISTLTLRLM